MDILNRLIASLACLFSLSFLITCGTVTAQIHPWRTVNLHPENGQLKSVDLDPSGFAVAVGENGLVETSIDTGSHWSMVVTSLRSTLNAVTLVGPKTIVAAGDSGYVLRSTNGVDWTSIRVAPNERFTGVSHDPSGAVLLVSESGVVRRSNDQGVSWTIIGPTFNHPLLAVKSPAPSVVIVSGKKGLTATTVDGGLTWKIDSLSSADLGQIAIGANSAWYVGGQKWSLLRSSDSGQSWKKVVVVADTVGASNAEMHVIGFFSRDTGIVFVSDLYLGYFDQYITKDGGVTWKSQNDASFGTGTSFATPHGQTSIVSGGNGGLKRSTNAGRFWRRVDPVTDFKHDLLAFANPTLGITCGSTFGKICFFVTNDGGLTWNKSDCLQTPRIPRTMSFPSADLCIAAGDSGSIFRSTDQGHSWTQYATSDSGFIGALRMYNKWNGILNIGSNAIKTTIDGGLSWLAIPATFLSDTVGINTFVYLTERRVLALTTNSQVYRSDDAGLTWGHYGTMPFQGDHMVFVDSTHGWATAEQDIIMATNDGGAHWTTELNKGADGLLDIGFSGLMKGIAVGYGMTIFETTNGGNTWTESKDSIVHLGQTITAVSFTRPSRAVGVTSFGLIILADYASSSIRSTSSPLLNLTVFPNPVNSSAIVRFVAVANGATSIELTNILGEIVHRASLSTQSGRTYEIQFPREIAAGVYNLTFRSALTLSHAKLIIRR